MTLEKVARKSELQQLVPLIVEKNGISVGLYRDNEKVYAYLNRCAHQGGPACEGVVVPLREYRTSERTRVLTREYKDRFVIVCPWHGNRYHLDSGINVHNKKLRLLPLRFEVVGDDIMMEFPEPRKEQVFSASVESNTP